MGITRRMFLHRSFGAGAMLLMGCGSERRERDGLRVALDVGSADLPAAAVAVDVACDDPFAGGELIEILDWAASDPPQFGRRLGRGWDGRRFYDLRRLTPDALHTPTEEFFLRTFAPESLSAQPAPWSIRIDGRVEAAAAIGVGALSVRDMGAHVLECAGNDRFAEFGLIGCARWEGVPLLEVLRAVRARSDAVAVKVNGLDAHAVPSLRDHSMPGASWVFTFDQLEQTGAFLATRMNGAPLPPDHGHPVRMVVPGWYGCTCAKWVDAITLVGPDEPATPQMREFAGRTLQPGVPHLARDYRPASVDRAALPVRVEHWRIDGAPVLRVVGIAWGGIGSAHDLQIRFAPDDPWQRVGRCAPAAAGDPWSLWEHRWTQPGPGSYTIRCRFADAGVPQRRLAAGFYDRTLKLVSFA